MRNVSGASAVKIRTGVRRSGYELWELNGLAEMTLRWGLEKLDVKEGILEK
jgi:hypothetical protein